MKSMNRQAFLSLGVAGMARLSNPVGHPSDFCHFGVSDGLTGYQGRCDRVGSIHDYGLGDCKTVRNSIFFLMCAGSKISTFSSLIHTDLHNTDI